MKQRAQTTTPVVWALRYVFFILNFIVFSTTITDFVFLGTSETRFTELLKQDKQKGYGTRKGPKRRRRCLLGHWYDLFHYFIVLTNVLDYLQDVLQPPLPLMSECRHSRKNAGQHHHLLTSHGLKPPSYIVNEKRAQETLSSLAR